MCFQARDVDGASVRRAQSGSRQRSAVGTEVGKGDGQFVGGKDGFFEDMVPDFSALDFILLGEETRIGMGDVYPGGSIAGSMVVQRGRIIAGGI